MIRSFDVSLFALRSRLQSPRRKFEETSGESTDEDVLDSQIANMETWQAMSDLAGRLTDDKYWGQP